jgi:pentatricopeptide repeat protein
LQSKASAAIAAAADCLISPALCRWRATTRAFIADCPTGTRLITFLIVWQVESYNEAIYAAGRAQKTDVARQLLTEMKGKGLKPNNMTYRGLVKSLKTSGDFEQCLVLLEVRTPPHRRETKRVYLGYFNLRD